MIRVTSRSFAAILAAGMFTLSTPLVISSPSDARGVRASAAGSMRGARSMSRPSPRPSANRGSVNRSNMSRPNVSQGANRGNIDRGSVNRDNVNRNVDRSNVNRDNIQNIDRSNIDRENVRNVDRGDREFNGGDRDFEFENDIDIDVDDGWDNDWGDHPIAAGVAFGTAAAITSAAIGSWAYALPSSCYNGFYGGYSYYHCGDVWYQPAYSGDQITYVVVEQPTEYVGGAEVPATPPSN